MSSVNYHGKNGEETYSWRNETLEGGKYLGENVLNAEKRAVHGKYKPRIELVQEVF